jgi:protein-S-isoprenylcysteine O-methyltransferase Ste14
MKARNLELRVTLIVIPMMLFMAVLVFVPAWTLNYWQGWLFLATLFIPMFFVFLYMLKHYRKLLEKRINVKEKREKQGALQIFNTVLFFMLMVIAGLDRRFGWSQLPPYVSIVCAVVMFTGYMAFIKTMLHNEYASRVIEIQKGQKLIDTGPYAVIRHPMYASGMLMYIFIPLVLGSWWGEIPMLLIPVNLTIRLLDEERMLIKELKGYKRYMKKVKYRLIPWVW